jgi:hypothetical protein
MRSFIFAAGLLLFTCSGARAQDPVQDDPAAEAAAQQEGAAPAGAFEIARDISNQLRETATQIAESLNMAERIEMATQLDILNSRLGIRQGDKEGAIVDQLVFAVAGPEIPLGTYSSVQSAARAAVASIEHTQREIARMPQLARIRSGQLQADVVRLLSYKKGLLGYLLEINPPFADVAKKEIERVSEELAKVDGAIREVMEDITAFRTAIYDKPIDIRCGPDEVAVDLPMEPSVQMAANWECRKKDENQLLAYVRTNPGVIGSIVGALALLIGLAIVYRRRRAAT